VDVGCGDGKLLAAVRACDPDLSVLGIDSSPAALGRAAAAGVPVEQHDLASLGGRELAALRSRVSGFDVAVSLETAEHLPPWAARSFVASLAQARLVVFSAAQPNQGGTLHLNERPPQYWRGRFAAHGFHPAASDAALRGELSRLDLPWWYAANIQVFERPA
jgi:cyclopropane fatty-acyl-phospholipid synthase-like methyltransferase